jgi:uncharacterized protein
MGLILIIVVFMIVSYTINARLKSKFKKYSQIGLVSKLSGKEIAEKMLADNRINDVNVVSVQGTLTDHYNPSNKTVHLSPEVYHGRSAAAAAIASHECGHAVQHATAYSFLEFRSALVPLQNVSARVLNFVIMISFFGGAFLYSTFPTQTVLTIIIGCYAVITLFSLITLPVEFDASRRALAWIETKGVVTSREHEMAKDALKWAALTYVVAALGSLVTMLYYIMILLGGRD